MKKFLALAFSLITTLASAQDGPNHSMPVFGGPGFSGFRAVGPCIAGQVLSWTGGVGVDPACTTVILTGTTAGGDLTGTYPNPTITTNVVTNAKLAQMPANTFKGNNTASTANALDLTVAQTKTMMSVVVNVTDPAFGALCNGTGNDATAINAAIASLPTAGGIVEFPASNCRITSAIIIGNGTSSAASTRQGVILRGQGVVGNPVFPGYTAAGGPKLTWAGATGVQGIIQINGPLQGWGIQNLMLDCAGTSGVFGLVVTSVSFGDSRDLVTTGCERGIVSTSFATFGSFTNTDSIHNNWENITINVPAVVGGSGILLTGSAGGTSNTDYNNFYNTHISLPTSVVVVTGIHLQSTDTVHFYQTHISGANASATCVLFDYSFVTAFPSSNRFVGVDVGNCNGGTSFATTGTPGAGARANQIMVDNANNTVCPIILNASCISPNAIVWNPNGNNNGTDILGAWTAFTPSSVCGTATFTTDVGRRMTMGKTTFISVNIVINALGTCAATLTFTLPATNQTQGSLVGQNAASGQGVTCRMGGTATATCIQTGGAAYAAGSNLIMSGVYENQ